MKNLKAELRPDKNGKLVTRWVSGTAAPQPHALSVAPAVARTEPRATKATRQDLEDYLENCRVTAEHPHADYLRSSIKRMSESAAEKLVHGLWEGDFGNDYGISHMLAEYYGKGSDLPEEIRDTVFKNFVEIVPHYGMNLNSENDDIVRNTSIIFEAVGGPERSTPFTDNEVAVYQTVACITNEIFRTPADTRDNIESVGFTGERFGAFTINGLESINILMENVDQIDTLRDVLLDRKTLHPDFVRDIAEGNVLRDGTL